jgi:hypothetical protein
MKRKQIMQRLHVMSIEEFKAKKQRKESFYLYLILFENRIQQIIIFVVLCGFCLQAFYQVEERHDEYEKDDFMVDTEEETQDVNNM